MWVWVGSNVLCTLIGSLIGAITVAYYWRKSVQRRIADEVKRDQQLQWDKRKKQSQTTVEPRVESVQAVGVRTAVTQIMQKRGWPIQEHQGVDPESPTNGRHRLHTREVRVVRRSTTP